jgi:hypothetical protein
LSKEFGLYLKSFVRGAEKRQEKRFNFIIKHLEIIQLYGNKLKLLGKKETKEFSLMFFLKNFFSSKQ